MELHGEVRIRPSQLGAVLRCPPILKGTSAVELDFENDAGFVGRAVHEVAKQIVLQNLPTYPDLRPVLAEYGVSEYEDEVGFLSWKVAQRWQELRKRFTDTPEVEKHLYAEIDPEDLDALHAPYPHRMSFVWSGIPDVFDVIRGEGRILVVDWKTGRTHDKRSDMAQMKAYALLAFEAIAWDESVQEAEIHLEWLREDEPMPAFIFTAQEIRQWADKTMASFLEAQDNHFTPSEACAYCPHWPCEGRNELMGTAVTLFSGDIEELGNRQSSGYPQDQAQLIRAYQQASVLEDMIGKFKKQFRVDLRRFGPLQANGLVATLQHVGGGQSFDTAKTLKVLEADFGIPRDELVATLSASKKAIMEVVRAHHPEGVTMKDYEAAALQALLDKNAAHDKTGYDRVTIKQSKS